MLASGCSAPRSAGDISDFANTVGRNGRDDRRGFADERADVYFAGSLRFFENSVEHEECSGGNTERARGGKRRADPNASGMFDLMKDHTESAESSYKGRDHHRAENGNARHAGVFEARINTPVRADVQVMSASAEQMAHDGAHDGEKQTETETSQVDKKFHTLYRGDVEARWASCQLQNFSAIIGADFVAFRACRSYTPRVGRALSAAHKNNVSCHESCQSQWDTRRGELDH